MVIIYNFHNMQFAAMQPKKFFAQIVKDLLTLGQNLCKLLRFVFIVGNFHLTV